MEARGFRKLRIGMAATMVGSALGPVVAKTAAAASTVSATSSITINGFRRIVGANNLVIPFSYGSANGFGIRDAKICSLTTPTSTNTSCPPSASPSLADPFLAAFVPKINGTVFDPPDGALDENVGTTAIFGTQLIGSLGVDAEFRFIGDGVVRVIFAFTNIGNQRVPAAVQVGTQWSSNSPVITGTEDGDTILEKKDSWMTVTGGNTNPFSPVVFGMGDGPKKYIKRWAPRMILSAPGSGSYPDIWKPEYRFNVPADSVKRLVFFLLLSSEVDGFAGLLDNRAEMRDAGLFDGITEEQAKSTVNYWKLHNFVP